MTRGSVLPALVVPSFAGGYATGGKSENPSQWDNLAGLWAAFLGSTGDTWMDMSGHNNHATPTGVTAANAWRHTRIGMTARVSDDPERFIVTNDPILKPGSGDMSWSFLLAAISVGDGDIIADRALGAVGTAEGYSIGHNGSAGDGDFSVNIETSDGSAKLYVKTGFWLTSDNWNLFNVTWCNSADTLLIYKNGDDVTSVFTKSTDDNLTGKSCSNSNALQFSGRPGVTTRCLTGNFSVISMHSRVLGPQEINRQYVDSNALLRELPLSARGEASPSSIMNQLQTANLGADLFNGTIIA